MQVRFERTGGFSGVPLRWSSDSKAFTPQELVEFNDLLDNSGFFSLPGQSGAPGADRFRYTITVETPDRSHAVTLGEEAVSGPLGELVGWLTAAARRK